MPIHPKDKHNHAPPQAAPLRVFGFSAGNATHIHAVRMRARVHSIIHTAATAVLARCCLNLHRAVIGDHSRGLQQAARTRVDKHVRITRGSTHQL